MTRNLDGNPAANGSTARDTVEPATQGPSENPGLPTAGGLAGRGSGCRDAQYDAALEFLYSRINYEKIGTPPYTAGHYRLDRMRRLLEHLGNPHDDYPIVHIAGTKGKGTTAHLLAAGLDGCGGRTGLYTSPHLVRLEERIQVHGQPCSPEQLIELVETVRRAAELLEAEGRGAATFFELTTAMGLLHFSRQRATAVVLEVGMGGRLDSTNVCSPILSVITSISLDHQASLGNTIAEIAGEKAGIIKQGIPVVCSARADDAQEVVRAKAAAAAASVWMIERDFLPNWRIVDDSNASAQIELKTHHRDLAGLDGTIWPTRLLGAHQGDNLAAAVVALELLREQQGWNLARLDLCQALKSAGPPGRLEKVADRPLTIVDTAHNRESLAAGLQALQTHYPNRPIVAIFASSQDKDFVGMLSLLQAKCQTVVLTQFLGNRRALNVERLTAAASELASDTPEQPCKILVAESPEEALHAARAVVDDQEVIYATGSFFLAAELLPIV